MNGSIDAVEQKRLALQLVLDNQKTPSERNRLGQFSTPPTLAEDILRSAASLLPADTKIHFLDPAIGTGSFYSALLKVSPKPRISEALGFEIDPHYSEPSTKLWQQHGLVLRLSDFTQAEPDRRFNLVICNPPYVRHHHLRNDDKCRMRLRTQQTSGMQLSGLAGLYCHFLGIAHSWMATDGIAAWLLPSEFMDVNYGQAVKQYLLDRVTLLHIHRFDPQDAQFTDAIVSSAIVLFRNTPPPTKHKVLFSFGGTLLKPKVARHIPAHTLAYASKWTHFPASAVRKRPHTLTLSDFFQIKRGLVTGNNKFFILPEETILARNLPLEVFTPILPSPRHLQQNEVRSRQDGSPDIAPRLFLLDTKKTHEEICAHYPTLSTYLAEGREKGICKRYLCSRRSPWYSQEHRPAAPIVCTYFGRCGTKAGRPFRFILNESRATVANVYLAMYPKLALSRILEKDVTLMRHIWTKLNQIEVAELLGEGRVYGGGLHKLEPRELGHIPATFLADLLPSSSFQLKSQQVSLF